MTYDKRKADRDRYHRNRDKVLQRLGEWRRSHRDRVHEYNITWNREYRERARRMVAESKGDATPRCRIDLTPDTPVSDLPCRGRLEIDHMNGGGNAERKRWKSDGTRQSIYHQIASGRRNLSDLRILCQLHQLWNRIQVPRVEDGRADNHP